MERAPRTHYSSFAKLLHWTMAIVVIIGLILGITIGNFGWAPVKAALNLIVSITDFKLGPLKNQLYDLHRSFGTLILGLITIRIAWRLISPPPPLPDDVKPWQRKASRFVHASLYIGLASMPMLGWIGTSLYGAKIKVFGLFILPPIVAKDRPSSELVLDIHAWLGRALAVIIVLHIAAALMHHFVHKDEILKRMLPGRKTG